MGSGASGAASEPRAAPLASSSEGLGVYVPRVQAAWAAHEPELRAKTIDGTLVFADVSGFTPLTERLARQGRVGAERLTEILNDVFGRLLGTAFSRGGDLLKFGGDALLLLFEGREHEARAASAAFAMQDDLRPYRRLRTESGTVSLRMSVGAASGQVHAVLVGSSHRELLVVGPVVSQTAELEAAADAGEVLLSPQTAAAIDPSALGRAAKGGVLLRSAPATRHMRLSDELEVDCTACVPVSLRSHLRGAGHEGEHRLVVVSFLQFKGTDDLLAAEGLDAVAHDLHDLITASQEASAAHGVAFLATDVDSNGGKVLFAAGAPVATPDDEDRMLFALREVIAAPTHLAVRAGVNRGHAFAVDMGAHNRRTYAVMGDATNLAARVMGKAPVGGVLATQAVLDRVGTRFELEWLEPFMVKGKSEPATAAVVGPPAGRQERERAVPLIGRDGEVQLLRTALTDAAAGAGRAAELVGEPGIGKTRLLAELVLEGPVSTVVEIGATAYARNSPYFALRAAIRRLLGVDAEAGDATVERALRDLVAAHAPHLEPWIALLDVLLGVEIAPSPEVEALDPRFRAIRLHATAADLLDATLPGPTLVLVDDAQWLDDASGALLGFLLNGIEDRPWLVCSSRRPVAGGFTLPEGSGMATITLDPLDVEAATSLVDALVDRADGAVAPHVRQVLVARGGGNPLFLEELTVSALEGRDVEELPDTVEGMLASRIDALEREDRNLLRRASVLGTRFARSHLAAMGELDQTQVDQAVARLDEFLAPVPPSSVEWRQTIVREIAYASLPFRVRRELHARAAALVHEMAAGDEDEWSDLLSLHHSAAEDHAEAWRWARVAAHRARANAAPIDAMAFLQRALTSARHLSLDEAEVAQALELLGEVAELGGRYDVAASAYARARRLVRDDALHTARLCAREGRLRERSGRASEALAWFTRGQRALEAAPPDDVVAAGLRADLVLRAAGTRLRQGRAKASVQPLDAVVAHAEAHDDRALLAHAYYLLDWAHSELVTGKAETYRVAALPIYEELGDFAGQANVLNNLGVDAYFEGRWVEALDLYERSREARAKAGDLVEMGTAANNIGEILSDQGHLDRAAAHFREALAIWRPAGFKVGVGLATSNLGRVATRRGDIEGARALLAEASERLNAVNVESLALEAGAREVERLVLAAERGALELAEVLAARAARLGGHEALLAMLDRLAGCALVQSHQWHEGRRRLQDSAGRARRAGARFELAVTLVALAEVDPDAGSARAEADSILADLGVVAVPQVPGLHAQPQQD